MREIKFRAWDKKEKSWLCTDMEYQECFAVQNSQAVKSGMAEVEGWLQPIYDVEIMQFTGLKDKNGKEIYEGDLVCRRNLKNGFENIPEVVEWRGGTFNFTQELTDYQGDILEVIGNIYENPELIGK